MSNYQSSINNYQLSIDNYRLPKGYKLTEVGVIPDDWEVKRLGELGKFKNGINKSKEDFGYGFPFVNLMDVFGIPKISNLAADFGLVNTTPDERDLYDLKSGDILFVRSSVKPEGVGLTTLIQHDFPNMVFSGFLIRFRDYGQLEIGFKEHCFFDSGFRARLISSSTVSANTNINQDALKSLHIAFPPCLSEQRSIASVLSDTDALLEALDCLIAKKRDLKQATMQQLLTGKTRLPGFTGEWEVKPLKGISTMHGRIGWQGLKQEEFTTNDSDPFLITGMNFKEGKIRWKEVYHIPDNRYQEDKNIQLKDGDILITKDGTIGKLLYVENIPFPGKASLNSHLLVFRPLNGAYNPKFLFYQLSSKHFADYVDLNKSGSTFFGITQEAVGNYQAYLPSLSEQTAIAQILSDMDTEIAALEQRRDKTRALKQGMMQELLTGRIRLIDN
jgi:type I restriction enzyme, S subunit